MGAGRPQGERRQTCGGSVPRSTGASHKARLFRNSGKYSGTERAHCTPTEMRNPKQNQPGMGPRMSAAVGNRRKQTTSEAQNVHSASASAQAEGFENQPSRSRGVASETWSPFPPSLLPPALWDSLGVTDDLSLPAPPIPSPAEA